MWNSFKPDRLGSVGVNHGGVRRGAGWLVGIQNRVCRSLRRARVERDLLVYRTGV